MFLEVRCSLRLEASREDLKRNIQNGISFEHILFYQKILNFLSLEIHQKAEEANSFSRTSTKSYQ
jgi:hypothetical protein